MIFYCTDNAANICGYIGYGICFALGFKELAKEKPTLNPT